MTTTAARDTASGPDLAVEPAHAVDWLLANARDKGSQPALRWREGEDWRTTTWGEHAEQVARAAAGLRALGVGPGDRVVLLLRNRPEFHVVDLAALALRATAISIYNSSAPEQVAYVVGHCGAKVVVVEQDLLPRVEAVRGELPALEHVVVVGTGGDSTYDELLAAEGIDLAEAAREVRQDDLATVIYTSGTTGPPKGVMIDHRNVLHQVAAVDRLWDTTLPDGEQERRLSFLPMAHIAERITTHYAALHRGCEVTTCPDLAQLGLYLGQTRPHVVFGPPRVWEKLKAGVEAAVRAQGEEAVARFAMGLDVGKQVAAKRAADEPLPEDLAQLWQLVDEKFAGIRGLVGLDAAQFAVTGAAPIPVEVIEFFRGLGVPFAEVYGMSENTGAMTLDVHRVKPGTVGRPLPGVQVRIADDGEVLCRGEIVFRGYLDDPERTAEALGDGWLHTGDIGLLDDEGYLRIVDRKKELIITAGGKNVSPANLEAALKTIPLVGQACVIGDSRPYLSALLVLDPDAAPAWAAAHGKEGADLAALAADEDLRAAVAEQVEAVNERFSQVEKIKRFALLGEEWLPDTEVLTPTMKLKRRGVKDSYAEVIESLYA